MFAFEQSKRLLWRTQESLRHGPLDKLADEIFAVFLMLGSPLHSWTRQTLDAYAYSIVDRGRRGRVFIVLNSSKSGRVSPFVRVMLFLRWVILNTEPEAK